MDGWMGLICLFFHSLADSLLPSLRFLTWSSKYVLGCGCDGVRKGLFHRTDASVVLVVAAVAVLSFALSFLLSLLSSL